MLPHRASPAPRVPTINCTILIWLRTTKLANSRSDWSPRASLTHDDARSAFHVDAPKFQFFNRDGNAWNATGKRAQIDIRSKQVAMRDDVRVSQASGGSQGRFVLTTQALDADTVNKRLLSAVTVTIQRPGSILRGIGFKADLDTQRFELASAVRGRFEVQHAR